jgi:ABC-type transporter Mla MlaB component
MSARFSLPADLTIVSLGSLRAPALEALPAAAGAGEDLGSSRQEWLVDASAVSEVDAAGVQLLISMYHAAAARRHALRLHRPSTRLVDACRALGVAFLATASDTTEAAA